MTTKKKAARAGTRTASNTAFDSRNHTATDALVGWFKLGMRAIKRQQKRKGGAR